MFIPCRFWFSPHVVVWAAEPPCCVAVRGPSPPTALGWGEVSLLFTRLRGQTGPERGWRFDPTFPSAHTGPGPERRAQGPVRGGDGEAAGTARHFRSPPEVPGPAHRLNCMAPPTAGSAGPRPPPEPFLAVAGDAFRAAKMAAPGGRCVWRGRGCWAALLTARGRPPAPLRSGAGVAGGRCLVGGERVRAACLRRFLFSPAALAAVRGRVLPGLAQRLGPALGSAEPAARAFAAAAK